MRRQHSYNMLKTSLFILGLLYLMVFSRCTRDEPFESVAEEDSIYLFINDLMHTWYLWYEEVPETDPLQYDTPQELLDAMKYPALDRWSFVDEAEVINSLFEEGEDHGFGFLIRFDPDGSLYVLYVYENTTAYKMGVRKGFRIETIQNSPPEEIDNFDFFFDDSPDSYSFVFRDANDNRLRLDLTKETYFQNGVFLRTTYNFGGEKIGYLVYNSFLQYTEEELNEAMEYFKSNAIDDLVIDLRYNQGGHIDLARELIEMLLPADAVGKPLFSYQHNDLVSPYQDTTILVEDNPKNLALSRIFFLTSKFSASASELVINSLEPYMQVFLIGSPTHGKPVGMYGFAFREWYVFPVTVKLVNAEGYGDFFDGLPVDQYAGEGLDKNWGDLTDPCLSQAIHYIVYGSFDQKSALEIPESSVKIQSAMNPLFRNMLILDPVSTEISK